MPVNPQRNLADALRRSQAASPDHILRFSQLSRADRELLVRRGFLFEIIKGWYALMTPQAQPGDTTFWHLHYWSFVAAYLKARYGARYCVSAEHSLDLWTESTNIPKQLVVTTARRGTYSLILPNGSSILIYPGRRSLPLGLELKRGVQVMPLAVALVRATPSYFTKSAANAELALRMVRTEDLSRALLTSEINLAAAGRLLGALEHLGFQKSADRIEADLVAAGVRAKRQNPFEGPPGLEEGALYRSPYVGRIQAMWRGLRDSVLAQFPPRPRSMPDQAKYLDRLRAIYAHDAYHSLSIEGYQVTPELIQRIADGKWDPGANPEDNAQVNAMAAKGYSAAFSVVLGSLGDVFRNQRPGLVFDRDLQAWYCALLSPSVQAGILPASALAGFRERRVFIRGSDHVPPAYEAVPELMETLSRLLREEDSPAVRAVLGHFVFVFIHPYADGNGRIGRFLMNLMLASGGFEWTVIRVDRRKAYMAALEKASVRGDISDFTRFIAEEMVASSRFVPGSSD